MDASAYADDLRLAHVLADQVEPITMGRFRASDLVVESKPDLTPVTEADREAERTIRDMLGRARTRDSVLGEEFPTTGSAPRQWVIDPIDGTKNFVRGVPVWATLVALQERRDTGDEVADAHPGGPTGPARAAAVRARGQRERAGKDGQGQGADLHARSVHGKGREV